MFKLAFTELLRPTDYHARKSLPETMREKIDNNGFPVNNLMMSDEVGPTIM